MSTKSGMILGVDDKRRLLKFFEVKNHVNLVLRVVDVIELRNDQQNTLIKLIARVLDVESPTSSSWASERYGWRKHWLLQQCPTGYIVLPLRDVLEPMSLEEIGSLQAIIYHYADIRRQKGEPHRVETCPHCASSAGKCEYCGDSGQVITFLEMSAEEIKLAEGAQ